MQYALIKQKAREEAIGVIDFRATFDSTKRNFLHAAKSQCGILAKPIRMS